MSDGSSEPVTAETWEQALAAEFAAFMKETRAAMNAAREGHWITDTEEVVRDAGERLRQRALEKLLQLRVQAGEGAVRCRRRSRTQCDVAAARRARPAVTRSARFRRVELPERLLDDDRHDRLDGRFSPYLRHLLYVPKGRRSTAAPRAHNIKAFSPPSPFSDDALTCLGQWGAPRAPTPGQYPAGSVHPSPARVGAVQSGTWRPTQASVCRLCAVRPAVVLAQHERGKLRP